MNESENIDEMKAEYDFSKGVRGKHSDTGRTGNTNMETSTLRRRRFRFSLWNLLVVVTISAFAFGLYGARKINREIIARNESLKVQMATIEEENFRLREEQGYLTIDDKSKIHAIRLPKRLNEEYTWTYRVYLPPGRDYFVASVVNNLPFRRIPPRLDEFPPDTRTSGAITGGMADGLPPGEYLMTLSVFEKKGKWQHSFQCRSESRSTAFSSEIRCKENEWPQRRKDRAFNGVNQKMVITTTNEPLKLLDLRAMDDKVRNGDLSHEGVILWVDAVSNYESDYEPDFDVYN